MLELHHRVCEEHHQGIKDVTNKKATTIRLSNAYLGRTIASARGGLELFAFGPAGFKPTVHPVEGSCRWWFSW
jgi:hypothetical protein